MTLKHLICLPGGPSQPARIKAVLASVTGEPISMIQATIALSASWHVSSTPDSVNIEIYEGKGEIMRKITTDIYSRFPGIDSLYLFSDHLILLG